MSTSTLALIGVGAFLLLKGSSSATGAKPPVSTTQPNGWSLAIEAARAAARLAEQAIADARKGDGSSGPPANLYPDGSALDWFRI